MKARQENPRCMVAYLFESDKFESSSYGNAAFEFLIKGGEVWDNPCKVVVSEGDIVRMDRSGDISPFIIRDNFCTISKTRVTDLPCAFLMEDIVEESARAIDARLKKECPPYIGMTSVNPESRDERKQFWKFLIRAFSVELNVITVFGCAEQGFRYFETAKRYGFQINYDSFTADYNFGRGSDAELHSTRQSSFIAKASQLKLASGPNDSDREILEMNFALVREVELAGTQIWKAVEDINRAYILKEDNALFQTLIDYIFTSLYSAAQGVERLLKIIIELIVYQDPSVDKKETDKLLFGHNHVAMYGFIEKKRSIKLKPNSKKLLKLLADFYKNARYHRFIYSKSNRLEVKLLREFGEDLKPENFDANLKRLYGKALGGISHALYEEIRSLSHELNIYVYELRGDSVAQFVFSGYFHEDLYKTLQEVERSKRELLWRLMTQPGERLQEQVKDAPPLPFDPGDMAEYLNEIIKNADASITLHEFVSETYDEMIADDKEAWKRRIDFMDHFMDFIGDLMNTGDDDCW